MIFQMLPDWVHVVVIVQAEIDTKLILCNIFPVFGV
jgi:hypothetical protein